MSFLTYNWGGDGRDVWPFIRGEGRSVHYDVSKLAQWEVVMDHAERLGLFLHIKMHGNFDMFPRRLLVAPWSMCCIGFSSAFLHIVCMSVRESNAVESDAVLDPRLSGKRRRTTNRWMAGMLVGSARSTTAS